MTISMTAILLSVGALMFNVGFHMGKYVGEEDGKLNGNDYDSLF